MISMEQYELDYLVVCTDGCIMFRSLADELQKDYIDFIADVYDEDELEELLVECW